MGGVGWGGVGSKRFFLPARALAMQGSFLSRAPSRLAAKRAHCRRPLRGNLRVEGCQSLFCAGYDVVFRTGYSRKRLQSYNTNMFLWNPPPHPAQPSPAQPTPPICYHSVKSSRRPCNYLESNRVHSLALWVVLSSYFHNASI